MTTLIPRDYQHEAVDSLFNYFYTHATGNPIVAMPTGTGKAFIIAYFLQKIFSQWSNQKILVATHVKELVEQNYLEFLELWPNAPAGVYSAGLGKRDLYHRIIFCGIASIIKQSSNLSKVDLLIIDECHLVSQEEESLYQRLIATLKDVNPQLRVIG
jgi:DNA repair protein RadD